MITILTLCFFQVNTVPGLYANIPSYRAFDLVDIGEEFAVNNKDELHFGFDSRQDRQMILSFWSWSQWVWDCGHAADWRSFSLAGSTGRLSTFLHGRSTPSCMLVVGSAAPHYSGVQCRLDIQLHWISISAKEVSLLWVPWMVVVRSHPLINLLYAMKSILSR